MIGLKRKNSDTITFQEAPLYVMNRQIRSLAHKSTELDDADMADRMRARNALGETFGTKKAKKAIKEAERNQVDVEAMANVAGYIQQDIAENTDILPTRENIKAEADAQRPLPPYDQSGGSLEEVYKISSLISDPEFNSCKVDKLLTAKDASAIAQLLPSGDSVNYIIERLVALKTVKGNKSSRTKVRLLLYMSYLFAFRTLGRQSRSKVQERTGAPPVIVDGLFSKFTETARGSTKSSMTPFTQAKLLNYILVLTLHVDDNSVDPSQIAKELSMPVQKINESFKSLGCQLVALNLAEREKVNVLNNQRGEESQDASKSARRATLKIPLEFPQVRRGKAKR